MEPWHQRLVLRDLKQVPTARTQWLLSAVPGVFQLSYLVFSLHGGISADPGS